MAGNRLSRQLKSIFGDESVVDRLRQAREALPQVTDPKARQALQELIDNLPALLGSVEIYYEQLDDRAALAQRNMETSSQELAENNAQLTQLNRMFEAMVDSLGQGFFLFDREGFCLPIHSKACETLLEGNPAGLHVADVLNVPGDKRETFNDWCRLLFEERVDFEDLAEIAPKTAPHSEGRIVTLEYKPVRHDDGRLEMVMVIATDRTVEIKAKVQAQKSQAIASLLVNILRDKERFRRFLKAVRHIFKDIYAEINGDELSARGFSEVYRHLHTLKGAAGTFGAVQMHDAVHALETRIAGENDLKVLRGILLNAVPEIDQGFESMLDEHREILAEALAEKATHRMVPLSVLERFATRIKAIAVPQSKHLYRDFVDEVVAMPVARLLSEFDITIQQVATKLGKTVEPIKFIGDDVSILPESIDGFRAALVHVFRNIVDHGIEYGIVREQRGKPTAGQVIVEIRQLASEQGPYLRIIINDDGNGIDTWSIRTRMAKRGKDVSALTDSELMAKIFDPGFSTASAVTEFSGRGVGLDAVKMEVERLGGRITVQSALGTGSAFIIELPLEEIGDVFCVRSRVPTCTSSDPQSSVA